MAEQSSETNTHQQNTQGGKSAWEDQVSVMIESGKTTEAASEAEVLDNGSAKDSISEVSSLHLPELEGCESHSGGWPEGLTNAEEQPAVGQQLGPGGETVAGENVDHQAESGPASGSVVGRTSSEREIVHQASAEGCSKVAAISLDDLVSEHAEQLYRYAYRLCGQQADAEDLVQQTFLQAQQHQGQLRDPSCARGWLFAILRNCFQMACRQNARQPSWQPHVEIEQVADLQSTGLIPDPATGPSMIDQEDLRLALQELSEDHRLILLMFYFEECSYRDIAQRLNVPLGTVMSRLSRAKENLREKLFRQNHRPDKSSRP